MPIRYHEKHRVFHLWNESISYIFCILRNGQLGHLYFGRRLRDREDFDHMLVTARRDMAPCVFEGDTGFSMDSIRQEYPVWGNGDLRQPACVIRTPDGARQARFAYVSHNVVSGKPKLPDLPATYVEDDAEAETLTVTLRDEVIGLTLELSYTVFCDHAAIARHARFYNGGKEDIVLERAMSVSFDLPDSEYEMTELAGSWARERAPKTRRLTQGIQSIYSLRGHSSHEFNPFLMLKRPETTEVSGEVYGISLVYSGCFLGQVDRDNHDVARVMMGLHPDTFSWTLHAGDSFVTPEAVLVYTADGMNAMSRVYHRLYRTRLVRGYWRDRPRPILVNNWEATYFDFDEDTLVGIARKASQLGVELFVLDDGWFGKRDSATCSLGDWFENPRKLPNGLKGLAEKLDAFGMKLGLWFEPEMISRDSELFRAHPDWMLNVPGYAPCHGRNQFELDFSRPEVVDAIAAQMEKILSSAPIAYVKWDMNRSMTDVFSAVGDAARQGEVYHRQILGVYALYERLRTCFPEILFESCASGGARFDPGMLYYAPQAWTSDDTDAVERVKIQYGTSYVYPICSMGSHVSAAPNHQLFRDTPLKTRADVAYFGTFGYELDLNRLTAEEQEEIPKQIAFMKAHQKLIMNGDFYRLIDPFQGTEGSWMVVSEDKSEALIGYYRIMQPVNGPFRLLRAQGLESEAEYIVREVGSDRERRYYGDELMARGFDVSDTGFGPVTPEIRQGDYGSRLFTLTRV